MTLIHGLFLPLEFPAGIAPGEGGDYNLLTVARNGRGELVLRGTAVAGALRHAWRSYLKSCRLGKEQIATYERRYFGYAPFADTDELGFDSPLQVCDAVINRGDKTVVTRTHHWRNRHTGVVVQGGLFSLEACPPGSTATVVLWLHENRMAQQEFPTDDELNEEFKPISAQDFLDVLVMALERGLSLGGKTARGVGMTRLDRGKTVYKRYNQTVAAEYAKYLDEHRLWRNDPHYIPEGPAFPVRDESQHEDASILEVDFCLVIPRGQDFLVGDGQGLDHEMEPQRVTRTDGQECWRLPGGSLRGIFRSWATRLAARSKMTVADHVDRYEALPADKKKAPPDTSDDDKLNCAVNKLFGSTLAAGRIHISDAEAPCLAKVNDRFPEEQLRMHVAVDRITGGAAESMLFDNTVLTAGPDRRSPEFHVSMRVRDPEKHEVEWLVSALKALDLGILRVGSSKSAGRLALKESPTARGKSEFVKMFAEIQPAEDWQEN